MKTISHLSSSLLVAALAMSSLRASGDDSPASGPIVQVKFDRLIPSAYPTVTSDFNRVRPTTFDRLIPTSFPTAKPTFVSGSQVVSFGLIPWSFPIERVNFNLLNQTTFNSVIPAPLQATRPSLSTPARR
jgi:hypothetical protein